MRRYHPSCSRRLARDPRVTARYARVLVVANQLNADAREAIATAPIVFVSSASAWEAAIKMAMGRLTLPEPFSRGVDHSGFRRLAVTFEHAEAAATLPRHHGDPFDRMLVAQAQLEECTLVTHDRVLAPYNVPTLWT